MASLVRPVTTLLLVRHGETDWNRDGRWQGPCRHAAQRLGRGAGAQRLPSAGPRATSTVDLLERPGRARGRRRTSWRATGPRRDPDPTTPARARLRRVGRLTPRRSRSGSPRRIRHGARARGRGADAEPFEEFAGRSAASLDDVGRAHPEGERARRLPRRLASGSSMRSAAGLDYVRDHRSIPGVANCAVARYAARDGKLAPLD